jgi:hypothetical protein
MVARMEMALILLRSTKDRDPKVTGSSLRYRRNGRTQAWLGQSSSSEMTYLGEMEDMVLSSDMIVSERREVSGCQNERKEK